ncbi:MAG: hypothetical protein JWM37_473 [Candidatus Saccharibacteria bacterium]|nr:hypothetical protein [Candidatus Saccharibacteria bacterium]
MKTRLNPYIGFRDNAREALEFYKEVFGGKLTLNTFGDLGATHDPSDVDKIMHGMLETESGLVLMGSDTPADMNFAAGANISISLSGDDEAELSGYYKKLSDGGTVTMPLTKASWGDTFGMVTDRFGIGWLVNITAS